MAKFLSRLVAAVLPIVLVILLGRFVLVPVTGPYAAPIAKKCAEELATKPITGIKALDKLLCSTLPLFRDALMDPVANLLFGNLISVLLVLSILWCVEASRVGSSLLLKPLPILFWLVQNNSAAITSLAVWIPIYLLTNSGDRSSAAAIEAKRIPAKSTVIIVVTQFLSMVSPVALLFLQGEPLKLAIQIFQVVPVIVPVLYIPFLFKKTVKDPLGGFRAVQLGYLLAAGAGFAWQVIQIVLVIRDPSSVGRILTLLGGGVTGKAVPVFGLLIDALGMAVSLMYFVFLEGGLSALLAVLATSIILGPATSGALFLAYREQFFVQPKQKVT